MKDWIKVKDALPAYGQRVLIRDTLVRIAVRERTDQTGEVFVLEGSFATGEDRTRRDVQQWMALPT